MMTLQRITRERLLTPEEAANYKEVRRQIANELPELIARHHERTAIREQLDDVLRQLRAERERRGLSLADVCRLMGVEPSIVTSLDLGGEPDPTIETLSRYADALGKRIHVSVSDE